ncbi:ribonuclease H-like domain-containing protein [Clostridium sp.]|uniref:ribonuclease H-like domain-containing protein n=1 Tax=Clostridium sp. TaxID=1506 RepID=UPI002607DE8D|nr:ribonuclease H-like domain-containing protein [Clostridium sp.]
MIIRENVLEVESLPENFRLKTNIINRQPEELIFFDLEHYVYKKPKCIGVFGACIYENNKLYVTQYMIENKGEVIQILDLAKRYFIKMKRKGKKAIVTFSGNNDYTVINYLFKKYRIEYNFSKEFEDIDIQREYEKEIGHSIGLKNLEKEFKIQREGDLISGSNLAKTFNKVLKDREYIQRMPKEKIETILVYNEQDVTNLYKIYVDWKEYVEPRKQPEEDKVKNEKHHLDKVEELEIDSNLEDNLINEKENDLLKEEKSEEDINKTN